MIRKIIQIDQQKCNGCGACASACQEGAIAMVDGKARLMRDDYCDGLGNCLPHCPTGAITFVEREAAPFDEAAVKAAQQGGEGPTPQGCPGSGAKSLPGAQICPGGGAGAAEGRAPQGEGARPSRLAQWPVQIKLAPVNAPYFQGAKLLVAADCTAYACAAFHEKFMKGHVTLIGCPKLDGVDYTEKLAAILGANEIRSVTVVRMEVPCCGGIERAVRAALQASGKWIPWQVVTIKVTGEVEE